MIYWEGRCFEGPVKLPGDKQLSIRYDLHPLYLIHEASALFRLCIKLARCYL